MDQAPFSLDALSAQPGTSAPALPGSWSLGGGLLGTDGDMRTELGCADATSSSPDWALGGLGWDLQGNCSSAVETLGRPEGPGASRSNPLPLLQFPHPGLPNRALTDL